MKASPEGMISVLYMRECTAWTNGHGGFQHTTPCVPLYSPGIPQIPASRISPLQDCGYLPIIAHGNLRIRHFHVDLHLILFQTHHFTRSLHHVFTFRMLVIAFNWPLAEMLSLFSFCQTVTHLRNQTTSNSKYTHLSDCR